MKISEVQMNKALLTVKELSSYLHVHPKTIYRLIEKRQIRHIKKRGLGIRFKMEDIEEWLASGENKTFPDIKFLPKLDLPLEKYDKMLLKGRSVLSKKSCLYQKDKAGKNQVLH